MEKLKIVLCDANRQELDEYANVCRNICEQSGIPANFKSYSNNRDLIWDMKEDESFISIDIVVVDPANGFDTIAPHLRDSGYEGMFLYLSHSELPEHFRQAFNVGACHFVQKSANPQILSQFHSVFEAAMRKAVRIDRHYLAVSYSGENQKIAVSDILYFEATAGHLVNIVHKGGCFKFLSTLQSLEERFGDSGFVRAHRSYLISASAIQQVDLNGVTLSDGYKVPVSRDRYSALKAAALHWQS